MTQKPRKGDLREKNQKRFHGGACLWTPLEAYAFDARLEKRSVFILDPRLQHYVKMLYTTTTKPLSTSQFYVDFKKIFFKDQKIETRLFIFKCFASCQVYLWTETLPFNSFTSREHANFISCNFFSHSCASSSFKGAAPKVLWEKVISRRVVTRIACVAGVQRGRGRGNLGALERKEKNRAGKLFHKECSGSAQLSMQCLSKKNKNTLPSRTLWISIRTNWTQRSKQKNAGGRKRKAELRRSARRQQFIIKVSSWRFYNRQEKVLTQKSPKVVDRFVFNYLALITRVKQQITSTQAAWFSFLFFWRVEPTSRWEMILLRTSQ